MQLQVGKSYVWKGKVVKLTAKWAQGKFFTYTFDDGSHFNGDPLPLVNSGELKISIEEPLPQVKINPLPPWTPKNGRSDGKTSKS
jgi:hypothetical protein